MIIFKPLHLITFSTLQVNEVYMTQPTTIIYLTGKPGVGKYTIAKELAAKYGFIVCDNQLINNPIFELLQYDGYAKIPDFAEFKTILKFV